MKVYDGLTSCSPPGTAPETRREQYGVRVTALDSTLVGAEGRCEQSNPGVSEISQGLVVYGLLRIPQICHVGLLFTIPLENPLEYVILWPDDI